MPLTREQHHVLEAYQAKVPRFLFRGFRPRSGGGIDPRLNNAHGVIPHGFLSGSKPTKIDYITNLEQMINCHLKGYTGIQSHFSSWAADIGTAILFSHKTDNASIAILDTNLVADHVKAYHVPALQACGLNHNPSFNYDHEYLVYGPIEGPAYHCVRYKDLKSSRLHQIYAENRINISYRGLPYAGLPYAGLTYHAQRLFVAKEAARLFRKSGNTQPDIIIALVVILIGYYCKPPMDDARILADLIQEWCCQEFSLLQQRPPRPGKLGLVNPETYPYGVAHSFVLYTLKLIEADIVEGRKLSSRNYW
ncbi:hypothetical protein GGR54DRAFT_528399 [Hypoxylon sp. NC1633]|nr:hypothetical protein GGR54DRAFT_528399 [Hypoxylon sp. NC1633]